LSSPSYGVCVCKLTQEGVPEEDKFGNLDIPRKIDSGWDDKFFKPIAKVCGYAFVGSDSDDD